MSYNFTYDSLTETIRKYLERNDDEIVALIPTFIMLAQRRIDKDCKNLGLQVYVQSQLTPGNAVIPKPVRWRNTITFNVGSGDDSQTYNQLYLRTYEFCRAYTPNDTTEGFPKYYCDYSFGHWLVVPTPDQSYNFEVAYYETVEPITPENQTNWLTAFAPELILYASMLEAMLYLKNDERTQYWQQLYSQATQAFNNEDTYRLNDRASVIKPGVSE